MDISLDEVVYFDFATFNPTTGGNLVADSTPTFAVYEESTDTDIGVGGNATLRTSLTNKYRISFTCSSANGFELGKWYSVYATAVVSGITSTAVVKNFRIKAAENVAGYPVDDCAKFAGQTITAAAGVTLPSSVASPTNITAGTITTVTTVTGLTASDVGAIKTKTDNLPSDPADESLIIAATDAIMTRLGAPVTSVSADIAAVKTDVDALPTTAQITTAVLTTQMTESYAADGIAPTLAQALFLTQQSLTQFSIVGTHIVVQKLDGTSTAATFTMDSATTPTLRDRTA